MDKERPLKQSKAGGEMSWVDYHRLDVIYTWLDKLQAENPGVITVMDFGKTYEGRTMKMVKLSKKEGNRAIMIEANIHAREWIGSATATWVLNQLLTSTVPEVVDMANNIDWYIIPVTNPDGKFKLILVLSNIFNFIFVHSGYEFTHTGVNKCKILLNWIETKIKFNSL